LLGLIERGMTDFIRVGSIKRIAKAVLPYTLHKEKTGKENDEKDQKSALQELHVCLQFFFFILCLIS
jgi:hypothetical protein